MRVMLLVAVLAGCGKGEGDGGAKKVESSAGTAAASATPSAGSGSSAGSAAEATPGVSPKIKAARCGEPCLFLVDTPYTSLVDTYKAECGGMETQDLGYGDCKRLDYMRNCIYAAHGLVFKAKKWKVFATKPWYDARPEFRAKTISDLERANVHELNQRGKACKKGLSITGGDYERINAWFKAFPKRPPMPELILYNGEPASAAEFREELHAELSQGTKEPIVLGKGSVVAAYIDKLDGEAAQEIPPQLIEAVKAAQPPPRLIVVDFDAGTVGSEDNPITEGTHVWFAYDDKDKLFAIAAAHYLYD